MKINTTDVRTAIYHSLQQWQSISLEWFCSMSDVL
uniref:Uncharacterized protein n=1 Tax=Iridovirus Liz-CrIV TaxID=2594309 RepID=A0A5B8RMG0_9VIRU|nr:putative protein 165R_part [Iridovirus Liz-CrIV]